MHEPIIKPFERVELVDSVHGIHEQVAAFVRSFTSAAWRHRQADGAWSPSEIVEHLLLVEEELLSAVQERCGDDPCLDWAKVTHGKELLLRRFLPNAGRAQASDSTSRFLGISQGEALSQLARSERRLEEQLAVWANLPLKAIVWNHTGFGPLSGYHWLLYIPLHSERHLNQLRQRYPIAGQASGLLENDRGM
ncbi:MAG: DinB family protein [Acidobacteriaceae bacterium]|nr:DinB family protein [Acidobacteriaceae bacterium]